MEYLGWLIDVLLPLLLQAEWGSQWGPRMGFSTGLVQYHPIEPEDRTAPSVELVLQRGKARPIREQARIGPVQGIQISIAPLGRHEEVPCAEGRRVGQDRREVTVVGDDELA